LMEETVTLARVLRGLLRLWPVRSAPHPHLCLRQSDIVAVHSPAITSLDKPPSCILRTFDLRARSAWSSHDLARRSEAQPDLCSRLRATLCPDNPDGFQQHPSALGRWHCRRSSSLSDVSVVPGRYHETSTDFAQVASPLPLPQPRLVAPSRLRPSMWLPTRGRARLDVFECVLPLVNYLFFLQQKFETR
jgi:hypothetical protein